MRLNLLAALTLVVTATAPACAHDRPDDARSADAQLTSSPPPPPDQLRAPTPPPAAAVRAELEAAQDKKMAANATTSADGGTSADTTMTADASVGVLMQGAAVDAGAPRRTTPTPTPTPSGTTLPVPIPLPTSPFKSPLTPTP